MSNGKCFYSKGEGNDGYIKNLEVLSFCEMDGTCGMFQMALYRTEAGRYLLYGACFAAGPNGVGVMISDVTDPRNPVFIKSSCRSTSTNTRRPRSQRSRSRTTR